MDTAKEEGKLHGDELSSSLQDKVREVAPSSQSRYRRRGRRQRPPALLFGERTLDCAKIG